MKKNSTEEDEFKQAHFDQLALLQKEKSMSDEASFIKQGHFDKKFNPYPLLNKIEPVFTPDEAEKIILLLDIKAKSVNYNEAEKYRSIIAKIQQTDGYMRYHRLI